MQKNDMRVFQGLFNYGTQAGMLAKGLRDIGIYSKSFVRGDSSKRLVDVDLSSRMSKVFIVRWFQVLVFYVKCLKNYNIFHFYFGKSILPMNMDLPLYHLFGKKVVMEYLGTDIDLWLGYNGTDWRNRPINRAKLVKRVARQAKMADVQLVCNNHLYQFVDNSIILPLAIDIDMFDFCPKKPNYKELIFLHCPTDRTAKKSDEIEAALNKLRDEGYSFKYNCVEHVTHDQLLKEYKEADVVIDQLNSWYGTVSVEAMAIGRPVICGIYRHYTMYDERFKELPIIPADVNSIYSVIKNILDGKVDLESIGEKSRKFVEDIHSLNKVTSQLVDIYSKL